MTACCVSRGSATKSKNTNLSESQFRLILKGNARGCIRLPIRPNGWVTADAVAAGGPQQSNCKSFDTFADLTEDKMINPTPDFWSIFGPWGPRRAPEALGRAPARKIVQVAQKNRPGDQF